MPAFGNYADLGVTLDGAVATVEIQRPPHNFFSYGLIQALADCFEDLAKEDACRAIMLCADGKNFCAGADFSKSASSDSKSNDGGHLYIEAVRLFRTPKPIVAAIQGAAIGGGLGLAMMPDFRVGCPEARFAANFTRLGFHPGFGLTARLPEIIGKNRAELMFYTSRRIKGEEAHAWGMIDEIVPLSELRSAAHAMASEIAECSPLGLLETRKTMRGDLADRIKTATDHELKIQNSLRDTADFKEGVKSTAERRSANWQGR